jgi:GntR family transcriptional regulator
MAISFRDSPVPRYLQIADLMRQRIARGQWRQGEKLPSLEALATEFGVARVTVRQAMERLSRDALVSPQQGRGTFVTGMPARGGWLKVQTTLADLADVYRDTKPEIVNIQESTPACAAHPAGRHRGPALRVHAPRAFTPGPAVLRDQHPPG